MLPKDFGTGFLAVEELPNGLLVLIIDYTHNCHLHFERSFHDEEFYCLRFETIHASNLMITKIGEDSLARLAKCLKMDMYDSILEEYIALRTSTLLLEPIQSTYKLILDNLKTLDLNHPAIRTIAHNRIMELIELFFTNLYDKRNQPGRKLQATRQDMFQGLRFKSFKRLSCLEVQIV